MAAAVTTAVTAAGRRSSLGAQSSVMGDFNPGGMPKDLECDPAGKKSKDDGNKKEGDQRVHWQSQRFVQETKQWSCLRQKCYKVVSSSAFEAYIGVLVLISFVAVVMEADAAPDVPVYLTAANFVMLFLYTMEVVIKLYVLRMGYFHYFFNNLDFVIVAIDLLGQSLQILGVDALSAVTALRIFRMMKLARGYKVIVKFPQLALMVKGLKDAASAALYGVALLFVILTIWSILAVQFIHPVNQRVSLTGVYDGCARCDNAFANVRSSLLTFFQQIVAGDSWGQVTIPIIEEAPETTIFFAMVFISVHFTIINVILAVIVDSALKASQEDAQEIVKRKAEEFTVAAKRLHELCEQMDEDQSGDLTKEELINGFDDYEEFRDQLLAMDIQKEDMNVVFSILDSDDSGSVHYDEFIQELFKMKSHDSHTLLVFIKHYVTEIRKDVQEQMRETQKHIIKRIDEDASERRNSLGLSKPDEANASATGAQVEEKQQNPRVIVQAESLKDLGEELRSLRKAISEDLVRSMKEMTQKSESHRLLLGPTADNAPFFSHSGDCGIQVRDAEGRGQPYMTDQGQLKPYHHNAMGKGQRSQTSMSSPISPSSAWAMRSCCRMQKGGPASSVINRNDER